MLSMPTARNRAAPPGGNGFRFGGTALLPVQPFSALSPEI